MRTRSSLALDILDPYFLCLQVHLTSATPALRAHANSYDRAGIRNPSPKRSLVPRLADSWTL
jgi:hypothetical protein